MLTRSVGSQPVENRSENRSFLISRFSRNINYVDSRTRNTSDMPQVKPKRWRKAVKRRERAAVMVEVRSAPYSSCRAWVGAARELSTLKDERWSAQMSMTGSAGVLR